jgi:hypothetical protein
MTLNNWMLEGVTNDHKKLYVIYERSTQHRGNLIAKETRFAIWFFHIGKKGQNLVQKLIRIIFGIKRNKFVALVFIFEMF